VLNCRSQKRRAAPRRGGPLPARHGGGEFAYALFRWPISRGRQGFLGVVTTMSVDQYRRILVETAGFVVINSAPT